MKQVLNFAAGIIIGGVLFGSTAALAASGILAEPSSNPVFVDGKQVTMEAYAINGNNYVKLRDIGEAVGFNVYWDGTTKSVQVDSDAAYTGAGAQTAATGAITIPQSLDKLTLKVGDVVQCDDGTAYTISDMSRYDANAFAEGPLPPLPTATCDWSSFPTPEEPIAEARRFNDSDGDYLFIRNLYETRRMEYTLMNLAGNNPETSKDGKLIYGAKGIPVVRIQLYVDEGRDIQPFWPWKEQLVTDYFNSCPKGDYQLEAWDVYLNGVFQYTQYEIG